MHDLNTMKNRKSLIITYLVEFVTSYLKDTENLKILLAG